MSGSLLLVVAIAACGPRPGPERPDPLEAIDAPDPDRRRTAAFRLQHAGRFEELYEAGRTSRHLDVRVSALDLLSFAEDPLFVPLALELASIEDCAAAGIDPAAPDCAEDLRAAAGYHLFASHAPGVCEALTEVLRQTPLACLREPTPGCFHSPEQAEVQWVATMSRRCLDAIAARCVADPERMEWALREFAAKHPDETVPGCWGEPPILPDVSHPSPQSRPTPLTSQAR